MFVEAGWVRGRAEEASGRAAQAAAEGDQGAGVVPEVDGDDR